jgi:hypothetical protein
MWRVARNHALPFGRGATSFCRGEYRDHLSFWSSAGVTTVKTLNYVKTPVWTGTGIKMTVSFIEACFLCQEYSMGLKLTTCDPENFGLLILIVADGTAGSLLAFFEHWLMSFHSPCDARY